MRWAVIVLAASVLGAAAQPATPPVESVTVTGERARDEQIKSFVQSHTSPAERLGKIARWESGVCPIAIGLRPAFVKFIRQRIRDIAAKVGAPVNSHPACRPNIEIVFTTVPQLLVDNIREHNRVYLGYRASNKQADALAVVKRPIQSWYLTATLDVNNEPHIDTRQGFGYYSTAVTGSRLSNGLHSGLNHVIIVADPTQLATDEIGALADYIAMLALAEPNDLDDCEALPSIMNLLAHNCPGAAAARAINDSDLGYLRGVYHMPADANLNIQQNEIAYQMKQTLGGH